jgi:hypothetical protein
MASVRSLPFMIVSNDPEVLPQGRSPETHPDLAILQVAEHRSSLGWICSVNCLSLMNPLPGHGPDYLVHLFGVLVVIIRLKQPIWLANLVLTIATVICLRFAICSRGIQARVLASLR